jgi:methionyl-tRNA formyltransferase
MRLLLLADHRVGLEITQYLIEHFPQDFALVVTTAENDIFYESRKRKIPVQVFDTNEALAAQLANSEIDLGVLAWWPKIIQGQLLELPRLGFINTHPSLLPYNRGKHYNFWAIVEEAPFGVSLHCVDDGIDSGDIVAQDRIAYDWRDTGGSLYGKAQEAMVRLFCSTYPRLRQGQFQRYPQETNRGSFHRASELEPASRLQLETSYGGREILNLLRARTFPGHPGCWFEENGERFEVRIEIRRTDK